MVVLFQRIKPTRYGYYKEMLVSKEFPGKSGQEKMQQIIDAYRRNPLTEIAGVDVICIEDYLTSIATNSDGTTTSLDLPKENVLKYILQDGSWIAMRPSGTEPKCKFYIGTTGQDEAEAMNKLRAIHSSIME